MFDAMTDEDMDRITRLAASGDLDEATYERVTAEAMARLEALLGEPAELEYACRAAVVPAPRPGEALFRLHCVPRARDGAFVGRYRDRRDAGAARDWARRHLPEYKGNSLRAVRGIMDEDGPLYMLIVYVKD